MIKKSIVKTADLIEHFGSNHVLLLNNSFRLSSGVSRPATTLGDSITGMDVSLDNRSHLSQTGLACWEINSLRTQGFDSRFLLFPKRLISTIEVDSVIEIASKVCERVMPGRWAIYARSLYLYYPEINITNSIGLKRTLKDIVVKTSITDTLLNEHLQGIRFSFTQSELATDYAHSHLPHVEGFNNFCRGDSSAFKTFTDGLRETVTELKFELFLHQLEKYLSWESVEGRPHRYLVEIGNKQVYNPSISAPDRVVRNFSKMLLDLLTPDLLTSLGSKIIYDPGVYPEKYLEMEQKIVADYMRRFPTLDTSTRRCFVDYDLTRQSYVEDLRTSRTLPNKAEDSAEYQWLIEKFKIVPTLTDDTSTEQHQIIKRPVPELIYKTSAAVNLLLQNYQKINE